MTYTKQELEYIIENCMSLAHEGMLDEYLDLIQAMTRLDPKRRTAIVWHGIHGVPFADIAGIDSVTDERWRQRYKEGFNQLLEILNDEA